MSSVEEMIESLKAKMNVDFSSYTSNFHDRAREEKRFDLEKELQDKISYSEKSFLDLNLKKQPRLKKYHTELGTIYLKRTAFYDVDKWIIPADKVLNLPDDGYSLKADELACVLGVTTEFAHAKDLFKNWTGIEISDHGLSNHIEEIGDDLYELELSKDSEGISLIDSSLTDSVCADKKLERVYLGGDGIMVPIRKKGYKEGKVGVIFSETEHVNSKKKRNYIKKKDYVATMNSREDFFDLLNKKYIDVHGTSKKELIFLGDGAKWLWDQVDNYYPDCVKILDFFHVSEYVWEVAREGFLDNLDKQDIWVSAQLSRLKESKHSELDFSHFDNNSEKLKEKIHNLKRYLKNHINMIDYKSYLAKGYMIGSGVVESSNKKVVTQRLKQSGMFWSNKGANAVMFIRAMYLSSSKSWTKLWEVNKVA
ncbi:MAG: ISKra4 family transposase [Candidatus Sericytochromatia bacterium]|nr:ISKra4 family transposase [Candidatus Sericytochromatia bacterium]